ncbi:MAG: spondin domain-containing protein [Gammaproteobacteria bacterium]
MNKVVAAGLVALAAAANVNVAQAVDFNVRIVNLTNGIHYTPFLIAAHPEGTSLFTAGQPASASLQAMAEGGDISMLVTDLNALSATVVEDPAPGILAPGASASADMNTDGTNNTRLSAVAMLLPTNDAFAGLNAVEIPTTPGTHVFNVPAYDAGTEANNELLNTATGGMPGVAGIPGAPGMDAGTGGTGVAGTDANQMVHIHRNTLGDTDPAGGASDLDSTIHRWLNPVIRIIVTVN